MNDLTKTYQAGLLAACFGSITLIGVAINPAMAADSAIPVNIRPNPGCDFSTEEAFPIQPPGGLEHLHGVTYNADDDHLYVLSADRRMLYKLTTEGELIDSMDIPQHAIGMAPGLKASPALDNAAHPGNFRHYSATPGEHSYKPL